jgi:predicted metal-dependent HD superfamily phosphohydrolase
LTASGRTSRQSLAQSWAILLNGHVRPGTDVAVTGEALLDDWSAEHRHYHDLAHLSAVLANVAELAPFADDPLACGLAAWYHDAVYEGHPQDEERSAARAEAELTALGLRPVLIAEVARLVLLTTRHDPAPDDRNGMVLCDADLAVLAAPPAAYLAYTRAVRAEYAHVPAEAFRTGRAAVLQSLLDLPGLFRTPPGRTRWEPAARANLSAELSALGLPDSGEPQQAGAK